MRALLCVQQGCSAVIATCPLACWRNLQNSQVSADSLLHLQLYVGRQDHVFRPAASPSSNLIADDCSLPFPSGRDSPFGPPLPAPLPCFSCPHHFYKLRAQSSPQMLKNVIRSSFPRETSRKQHFEFHLGSHVLTTDVVAFPTSGRSITTDMVAFQTSGRSILSNNPGRGTRCEIYIVRSRKS